MSVIIPTDGRENTENVFMKETSSILFPLPLDVLVHLEIFRVVFLFVQIWRNWIFKFLGGFFWFLFFTFFFFFNISSFQDISLFTWSIKSYSFSFFFFFFLVNIASGMSKRIYFLKTGFSGHPYHISLLIFTKYLAFSGLCVCVHVNAHKNT